MPPHVDAVHSHYAVNPLSCHPVRMNAPAPADEPTEPAKRPDYEDFRDAFGHVDWVAFRAAVAAYDPDMGAPPSGG